MEKSAIITVTSGDFEYIDEWIEYHHNLGVDLFLIGYNGPSEKMNNYKQYDYVRYIDFSYNDSNKDIFKNGQFSGWFDNNIYNHSRMQKIENVLFNYLKWIYQNVKYCIVIDTDEFINIKNPNYNNINQFLSDRLPNSNSSISINMNFATDNNLIYKEDKPCMERFTNFRGLKKIGQGGNKIIINMFHNDVKHNRVVLTSPHTCSLYKGGFDLNFNEIELIHFWTKTLEEWIEKMNPEIDQDYFNRFRGHIFYDFFHGVCNNLVTDIKLKAIPGLLKKHHIDYDINEEIDSYFKERYFQLFPEQKK